MEHLLFEHILGYELFELKSFEGLSLESYADYNALTQVITHISSLPFQDIQDRVAFIQMEDELPEKLLNFFQLNNVKVLHADKSLERPLEDAGIEYKASPNIIRGIKQNIHRILKTEIDKHLIVSTAHRMSRDVIKYDMEREDNLGIAVSYECEHLEDEIYILSERMRHMVDWIIPQLKKIVKREDYHTKLNEILTNRINRDGMLYESLLDDVLSDLSESDLESLKRLNNLIIEKKNILSELKNYLSEKLDVLSPNLRIILGDQLCIKMIHKAGGLVNLSLLPSSTLQLLGAEKSLFRSLKMRRNTPKYGILYGMDGLTKNKGRMSRFIANKCSLAARIDTYSQERTNAYGQELKRMIDKKMKGNNDNRSVETTTDVLVRVQKKLDDAKASKRIQSKEGYEKELKTGKEDRSATQGIKSNKKFYDSTESSKNKMSQRSGMFKKDKRR